VIICNRNEEIQAEVNIPVDETLQSEITDFITEFYLGEIPRKHWESTIEGIDEIKFDLAESKITIFMKRGAITGKIIGKKGIRIKTLTNKIWNTFAFEWRLVVKSPPKWFCPTCEVQFEQMAQLREHHRETDHDQNYSDSDLSLDRKILGVCQEVNSSGDVCGKTRYHGKETCLRCSEN
jgi:hypothetical protein